MNDDRDALVRLLPDPARHDLPGHRHHVLREGFMQQLEVLIDESVEPTTAVPPPVPRRRFRVAGLSAAVLTLVAALWVAVPLTFGVGTDSTGQTPAGELLERIALVAATSTAIPSADQVRDDQFAYIETYGLYAPTAIYGDSSGIIRTEVVQEPSRTRRIWLSVDGSRPGLLRFDDSTGEDSVIGANRGGLTDPTFRSLARLPTDPDVLLDHIYAETAGQGNSPQQQAFSTIGVLMREAIVPPDVAAALYRAAARIPGVTVLEDVVDALGRPGIAVARTEYGARIEMIFDRTTLQLLGERGVHIEADKFTPAGTVSYNTAIVTRAIVDRVGDRP